MFANVHKCSQGDKYKCQNGCPPRKDVFRLLLQALWVLDFSSMGGVHLEQKQNETHRGNNTGKCSAAAFASLLEGRWGKQPKENCQQRVRPCPLKICLVKHRQSEEICPPSVKVIKVTAQSNGEDSFLQHYSTAISVPPRHRKRTAWISIASGGFAWLGRCGMACDFKVLF